MNTNLLLAALVLLFGAAICEATTSSPAIDYNYTSITLLNVSNVDDISYQVNLPFTVRFQGAHYSTLYFCSNSYITFGGSSNAYRYLMMIPYKRILIDATDNYATRMVVTVTDSNATIWYCGRRYNGNKNQILEWKITFFNVPYEKFVINIINNTLLPSSNSLSQLCTATNCYQQLNVNIAQALIYWDCEGGCVNELLKICQYCGVCNPTASSVNCSRCLIGYAFTPSTKKCILCSSTNNTVYNGQCYTAIEHCSQYNTKGANTISCTSCINGYALHPQTGYCIQCSDSTSLVYEGKCYSTIFHCQSQILPTKCDQCHTGYTGEDCSQANVDVQITPNSKDGLSLKSILIPIFSSIGGVGLIVGIVFFARWMIRRKHLRKRQDASAAEAAVILANSLMASPQPSKPNVKHCEEPELCSICLEAEVNVLIACRHYYHVSCITQWLVKNSKCPNCNRVTQKGAEVWMRICQQCKQFNIQMIPTGSSEPPSKCKQCLAAARKQR